jgi:hypothetical protein
VAAAERSLGQMVKRLALFFLGLTGAATAVAGALATMVASHGCTLARTGTVCYPSAAKVFFGVALLVCGICVVTVVLLKGWSDHRAVAERKRWRHLESVRLPSASGQSTTTGQSGRSRRPATVERRH